MIAKLSQTDRRVRWTPDSHPIRPSRPVPSRPLCRYMSPASHPCLGDPLAAANAASTLDVGCDAFGESGRWSACAS